MRNSKVLQKLRAGKPTLMTSISLSCNPMAVELAGRCGLDSVWIDMEHRPFTQREVATMISGARIGDVDVMVRIRKGEGYTSFFRPFEDGATGIMVPHIKTKEEAEWVIYNSRYYPQGRRGAENIMADADLGFVKTDEYMKHANEQTFVAIQIEDAEGVEHIEEIASVKGFDIFFLGPLDLSCSLGVPMQYTHPTYTGAVDRIIRAAEKYGKWWGQPVADIAGAAKLAERGARFFNIGTDYQQLKGTYLKLREEFDKTMK